MTRAILVLTAAGLLLTPTLAGCASKNAATTTVIVTETAAASGTPAGTSGVTVGPLQSGTESGTASPNSSAASTAESSSSSETTTPAAPIVTVDPLKADCAKILNSTEINTALGVSVPAGTNRIVDVANAERKMTGRIKCQYGVAADKSSVAVTLLLAQYTDAAAAQGQISATAETEKSNGAKASTASIQGHPAQVLLRQGGLLIVGYDTWTLSVVVADKTVSDDRLPAALAAVADYSLTKIIS